MTQHHAHSAGDSDPSVQARRSKAVLEPVLMLTGLALATQLGAAAASAAQRPGAARLLLGAGALATAVAGVRIRGLVTPMARPQDRLGEPLTPLVAAEPEHLEQAAGAPVAAGNGVATEDPAPPPRA